MPKKEPTPSLRPTAPGSIAIAGLLSLSVSYVAVSRWYGQLPRLEWFNAAAIVVIAILLGFLAWRTHRQIHPPAPKAEEGTPAWKAERPTEPVNPLLTARVAVLGKASVFGGAILMGLYGALSLYLWLQSSRPTPAIRHDTPNAVAGFIASALLLAAALWLEYSCRVPPEDDEDGGTPASG
ncbi:DUF3180 domain-containing protein [Salininema proteolyticum]|uniref:DUF3180 domain-containing protein n=1 Tax=Salininema proteolyticum TaxID=1607685 RepID=A0ABV8U404_9ACTN